ncbi:hypothetical protein P350_34805 [Burkholderia cepacia JBK9]|uniref:Uncharacterized protein n=1 Tax=Burkholderia arboris TaxID=488730 RepID=A0A9Q9SH82_9BURK|nr:hypothetical protein [Burkholderia arboris]ALX16812.1 hypothetical protein P350_34805 [Burkholderia cepacia JBK9]MCA8489325.1 hypothetical protein [Burkholderia arboris]UTV60698.1 hypothetical protein NLX30_36615 [Burkholderia arboris]VWB50414.1 hypothetical protein BAR24066_02293 [Burkholderia arboris]
MSIGNVVGSVAGGANSAAATGGIIGQLGAAGNEQLAIAGAVSNMQLKQATGEAMKAASSGVKEAAKPS